MPPTKPKSQKAKEAKQAQEFPIRGAMDDSPLGRLPPELRNNIFEMAFAQQDDIHIQTQRVLRKSKAPPVLLVGKGKHTLALTHVCRQLRVEAKTLFYSANSFVIELEMPTNAGKQLGVSDLAILDPLTGFLGLVPSRNVRSLTLAYGPMHAAYPRLNSVSRRKELFDVVKKAFQDAETKVFGDLQFHIDTTYSIPYAPYRDRTVICIDAYALQSSIANTRTELLGLAETVSQVPRAGEFYKERLDVLERMLTLWLTWFEG